MICPNCTNPMEEVLVHKITVDVCRAGCGGIFFDRGELAKIKKKDLTRKNPLSVGSSSVKRVTKDLTCPRCEEVTMIPKELSADIPVMIDRCFQCGGLWLDHGEFKRIYQAHKNTPKGNGGSWADALDVVDLAEATIEIVFDFFGAILD